MGEADAYICDAECTQFCVRVDLIAIACREGPRSQHVVGEGDNRDSDRWQDQRHHIAGRHARQTRCGPVSGDRTNDLNSLGLQRQRDHPLSPRGPQSKGRAILAPNARSQQ